MSGCLLHMRGGRGGWAAGLHARTAGQWAYCWTDGAESISGLVSPGALRLGGRFGECLGMDQATQQ
ncbi:hypothetical protein Vi05172_g12532 [Venturia inaequalis]|nr:hypothetical protein Vi05172_g13733 [Venturia inaequalis]RDI77435.1 hypothetical protein Vi05172_g12532 [Venturia inaequalis]